MVLLTDGSRSDEAEGLAELQHGFGALDGAPCGVGELKATDLGHVLLDPETVALNFLLQVFRDIVDVPDSPPTVGPPVVSSFARHPMS